MTIFGFGPEFKTVHEVDYYNFTRTYMNLMVLAFLMFVNTFN